MTTQSFTTEAVMTYRVDFTIRNNGLEQESCHYCADLAEVNEVLARLEAWKAWGFQIHEVVR